MNTKFSLALASVLLCLTAHATPFKVAIIDSGYTPGQATLCPDSKDFTGSTLSDEMGHGTNILGLITEAAGQQDKWCAEVLKVFDPRRYHSIQTYKTALEWARLTWPDLLNLSLSGTVYSNREFELIEQILDQGTIIVAAAGNEERTLDPVCGPTCSVYPACLDPRIIKVANSAGAHVDGLEIIQENGKNQIGYGVELSGSSQATAKVTGRLLHEILELSK